MQFISKQRGDFFRMMKKEEFVKICVICGYASKKNAQQYAESKEELTDDDFEKVHLLNEQKNDIKNGATSYHRRIPKSGDALLDSLAKTPKPWNRTFDASRLSIDGRKFVKTNPED